jgi:hypothetical protein
VPAHDNTIACLGLWQIRGKSRLKTALKTAREHRETSV